MRRRVASRIASLAAIAAIAGGLAACASQQDAGAEQTHAQPTVTADSPDDAFVCGVGSSGGRLAGELGERSRSGQISNEDEGPFVGLIRAQFDPFTTWSGESDVAQRFRKLAEKGSQLEDLGDGSRGARGGDWLETVSNFEDACSNAGYPSGTEGAGG